MTEKELKNIINIFVKLNPKRDIYPKLSKYDSKILFDVQNLFKNNFQLINQNNYNNIFSSKDGRLLSGKKWISILVTSKNINDYHTNLRRDFEKCNQKKLLEKISKDLFLIYYHDENSMLIKASEVNFDVNVKRELEKIRFLLDEQDWSNYFFNLQTIMHKEIINFLNWKSEKLKYDLYIKNLKKEINNDFIFNKVKIIIDDINLYRNSLIKITAGGSKISQDNKNKWNIMNNNEREIIGLDFYFKLIFLANVFKRLKNKK